MPTAQKYFYDSILGTFCFVFNLQYSVNCFPFLFRISKSQNYHPILLKICGLITTVINHCTSWCYLVTWYYSAAENAVIILSVQTMGHSCNKDFADLWLQACDCLFIVRDLFCSCYKDVKVCHHLRRHIQCVHLFYGIVFFK